MIHILMGENVLENEHGIKLAVSVPLLKLGKHFPDPARILRDINLALICFQDRIPVSTSAQIDAYGLYRLVLINLLIKALMFIARLQMV